MCRSAELSRRGFQSRVAALASDFLVLKINMFSFDATFNSKQLRFPAFVRMCITEPLGMERSWARTRSIHSAGRRSIPPHTLELTPFSSYFTSSCVTGNKPRDGLYSRVLFEGKEVKEKCVCTRQSLSVIRKLPPP